mgnify:CR=1 FL=1
MTLSRLYECLEEWRDYYKHSSVESEFGLGFPKESLVVQSGGSSSKETFDHMCDDMDSKVVRMIDAMVDSLTFPQRDAIKHQWLKEYKCWPTHEMDYDQALGELLRLADKRGLE